MPREVRPHREMEMRIDLEEGAKHRMGAVYNLFKWN